MVMAEIFLIVDFLGENRLWAKRHSNCLKFNHIYNSYKTNKAYKQSKNQFPGAQVPSVLVAQLAPTSFALLSKGTRNFSTHYLSNKIIANSIQIYLQIELSQIMIVLFSTLLCTCTHSHINTYGYHVRKRLQSLQYKPAGFDIILSFTLKQCQIPHFSIHK